MSDAAAAFRDRLIAAGVLIPTGVDGLFGRSRAFEAVVDGFDRYVSRMGRADEPEVVRFPPMLNRTHLKQSGYLTSFPHLAGSVTSFAGGKAEHAELVKKVERGEEWANDLAPTEVALTPAACYPVYPMAASRGPLPEGGRLFDVFSYCFRHEPSLDPARMQAFRMREFVRLGTPADVKGFRDGWLERTQQMFAAVGLAVEAVVANDPFFGQRGRLLSASQREQELKFEIVAAVSDAAKPTAIASCNYHLDHLSGAFGVRLASGEVAHTACVGFGLERITLGLFATHGFAIDAWPDRVREVLGLDAS